MSDDVKLTTYALNQLPTGERARLESELATSADDRQAAQELSRLGELLRTSLAKSPLPEASADLRRLVEDRLLATCVSPLPLGEGQGEGKGLSPSRVAPHHATPPRRIWLPISFAAALLVTAWIGYASRQIVQNLTEATKLSRALTANQMAGQTSFDFAKEFDQAPFAKNSSFKELHRNGASLVLQDILGVPHPSGTPGAVQTGKIQIVPSDRLENQLGPLVLKIGEGTSSYHFLSYSAQTASRNDYVSVTPAQTISLSSTLTSSVNVGGRILSYGEKPMAPILSPPTRLTIAGNNTRDYGLTTSAAGSIDINGSTSMGTGSLSRESFSQFEHWTFAGSGGIDQGLVKNGTGSLVLNGNTLSMSGLSGTSQPHTTTGGVLNAGASLALTGANSYSGPPSRPTLADGRVNTNGLIVANNSTPQGPASTSITTNFSGGTVYQTDAGSTKRGFGMTQGGGVITSGAALDATPVTPNSTTPSTTTPTPTTRPRDTAYTVVKPTYEKLDPSQPVPGRYGGGKLADLEDRYERIDRAETVTLPKGVEQQLLPLMLNEQQLLETYGTDHPRVKAARARIQLVQDALMGSREDKPHNTEAYDSLVENTFLKVADNPLSTFSIDVDTASYTIVRRFLTQQNRLPPPGAVRLEEFINYFSYDYPQPEGDVPFSVTTEVADCPWNAEHRLVRIGLKGREIAPEKRPLSNLVFLVDVSGSMAPANRLPLVKQAMKMLAEQLGENDRVAIVVYAGASGLVLPSTRGDRKDTILAALERLQAGGSTNGAQGLELAYETAAQNFIKGGTNRVILATDGDFNVGVTSQDALVRLIEEKAKTGVFFTALGFGMGNLKDSTLEKLADKGNGNYAYIDSEREARKVFVEQMCGTLVTIAKDVKLQLEFNPARVGAFRLLGYENRVLAHEDFNNDKKDAGEIGAGHTVTALYELIPPGKAAALPAIDPLKYQRTVSPTPAADAAELLTVKLRYKQPDGDTSKLIEHPVADAARRWAQASVDFKFAASVASFGMLLRNSTHKGNATTAAVLELATEGLGSDPHGHRAEFIELVRNAKGLGK